MPRLRGQRRDHRARAPKRRKRRNLVKFIPEADSDFAFTALQFASRLKNYPDDYGLSAEEIAHVGKVIAHFREAMAAYSMARLVGQRSPHLTSRKDAARHSAETTVRMYANLIRANPRVTPTNKTLLRIKERPAKPGKRPCPKSPPRLQFLGSGDGVTGGIGVGSGSGVHVLKFVDANEFAAITASCEVGRVRRAKPDGAVRVELYFDMVPVGESLPRLPNERGWPKYLRSFTRSPMEVEFPIPVGGPMLFVYWARWADSTGQTSRWSKPCVARVEGWTATKPALPEGDEARRVRGGCETKYVFVQTPIAGELPDAGSMAGDDVADEIAALMGGGQRMLEATAARMLGAT